MPGAIFCTNHNKPTYGLLIDGSLTFKKLPSRDPTLSLLASSVEGVCPKKRDRSAVRDEASLAASMEVSEGLGAGGGSVIAGPAVRISSPLTIVEASS